MEPKWPEHFSPEVVREGYGGKLSSFTIALEAWRRGLQVSFTDVELRRYTIADANGRTVSFIRSRPHMTTRQGVRTANNKHQTAQLLNQAGVPAPASTLIETSKVDVAALSDEAKHIGYPVVLKPLDGSMGKGVFAGIQDEEMLAARYSALMRSVAPTFAVLESHVPGADYRVLVYDKAVAGVCLRLPANVIGDGRQTVRELIEQKNATRRKNPFLSKGLIIPDYEVEDFLQRQGLHLDSVPSEGHHIRLRSAANASAGGDVVDVTDTFPANIKEAAVAAVQAIPGLYCAGVDILFDHHATGTDTYSILELNAHPQIGVNMFPTQGAGQDVPQRILDTCFPGSQRNSDARDKMLSLPRLGDLLWPLRVGSADAVTVGALPEHRLTDRRICTITPPEEFTVRQRTRLLRVSRTLSVSGFLRKRGDRLQMLVASSPEGVNAFISAVREVLGIDPNITIDLRAWRGPVSLGFYVDQALTTG